MRGKKRKVWSWRDENDLRKEGIREKTQIKQRETVGGERIHKQYAVL